MRMQQNRQAMESRIENELVKKQENERVVAELEAKEQELIARLQQTQIRQQEEMSRMEEVLSKGKAVPSASFDGRQSVSSPTRERIATPVRASTAANGRKQKK